MGAARRVYRFAMRTLGEKLEPWGWRLLVVAASLPIVAGALLIQLIGPADLPLDPGALRAYWPEEARPFLPGLVTLAAVLTLHVCLCFGGIALALLTASRAPDPGSEVTAAPAPEEGAMAATQQGRTGAFGARSRSAPPMDLMWFAVKAAIVITLGLILLSRLNPQLFQLSYIFFRDVFAHAGPADLLRPGTLEIAMLVPTVLGTFGVAMVTAAAATLLRAVRPVSGLPNHQHEIILRRIQNRLKRFLYILSAGLVASTIAVSLFFSLPANLPACRTGDAAQEKAKEDAATAVRLRMGLPAAEEGKAPPLQGAAPNAAQLCSSLRNFANEMSTFWGAVLSLALFFCGGLPLLILQHKVRCYIETSYDQDEVAAAEGRLKDTGVLSDGRDQIKVALSVLAPLASGPAANLLEGLTNAAI